MMYLSLSDLMLVDGFKECYASQDKEGLFNILFTNGLDTKKGVKERVCLHRNLRGQAVHCLRYEAIERVDRLWKDTGCASLDAWVNDTADPFLRSILKDMSRDSFSQVVLEAEIKNVKQNINKRNEV